MLAKHVYAINHATLSNLGGNPQQVFDPTVGLLAGEERRIAALARFFEQRGIKPSLFHHSRHAGPWQTCNMLRRLLKSSAPDYMNVGYGPNYVPEWNASCKVWQEQTGLQNPLTLGYVELLRLWPELCKKEGEKTLEAVKETAKALAPGQYGFGFGHGPLMQFAELLFLGQLPEIEDDEFKELFGKPDLSPCQVIRFSFQGSELCGVQEIDTTIE